MHLHHDGDEHHHHEHTLLHELKCHLPSAIYSVALGLSILSVVSALAVSLEVSEILIKKGVTILFHSFHFMHILFASTGTLITFFRFSKSIPRALIVGIINPAIFCMLSDAVLPYIGGTMLGVPMTFHVCFWHEWHNVLPFLLMGIINGFVMRNHIHNQKMYGLATHSVHIFLSSLASIFYLVGHGFVNWYEHIGMVFLFLVIAVVVPCTMSDVVVPMAIAKK